MPSGFCFFHDPECAEKRDEARKRGGQQTSRQHRKAGAVSPSVACELADLRLEDVGDVVKALADTFNKVRKGELDVRIGNCLGVLAGTLLRAFRGDEGATVRVAEPVRAFQLTDEKMRELFEEIDRSEALRQQHCLQEISYTNPPPTTPLANGEAPHA
jgi:hypothetical protein